MTKIVQAIYPSPHPCALIRKKRLLELLPFSKTTLHAKLTEGGRFEDISFPRPIYPPNSRTPFWRESEVLAWIEASALNSRACATGKRAAPSAVTARNTPAASYNHHLRLQDQCQRLPDDATGASPSENFKPVKPTIGGRPVVMSTCKVNSLYLKRPTSSDTET